MWMNVVTWADSVWWQVLSVVWSQSDHVQSPEEVSIWFGNVLRDFSLIEVSLWLLCSHLAKRSKLRGREHFRVQSNFYQRTRCEKSPRRLFRVVLSISTFPPRGWLAYLISSYYWHWFTRKRLIGGSAVPHFPLQAQEETSMHASLSHHHSAL